MQLLGAALLVSPFFFWGTSMVAMKVRSHSMTGSRVLTSNEASLKVLFYMGFREGSQLLTSCNTTWVASGTMLLATCISTYVTSDQVA